MNDDEAYREALRSVDYLQEQCQERGISLTIRINPMYIAQGSRWAKEAEKFSYKPPRFSDILNFAKIVRENGIPAYIGLSTEGLAIDQGDYRSREDFTHELLVQAIKFNCQ